MSTPDVRNKIVVLTVSIVVLAGVLSGGATLWHARRLSNSYDDALKLEMEGRALAISVVAEAFLDLLGVESLSAIEGLLQPAGDEPTPDGELTPLQEMMSSVRGFEVWERDPSSPGGFRQITEQQLGDPDATPRSEEVIQRLLAEASVGNVVAAVVDEEAELILSAAPIDLPDGRAAISVASFSAGDQFAFLAQQRRAAIRDGILLSVGVVAFVSVVGGGLSYAVSRDVTSRKRAEEALREKAHDLGERVKELNCLYGISNLVEQPDVSTEDVVRGVAGLIPPSWQYPEVTCARVTLEGREYQTEDFAETGWKQSADIVVAGERAGGVEVYYLEERPESDEGPFLKEERILLDAIAERLGEVTERKRAEAAQTRLTAILDATPDFVSIVDRERRPVYLNSAGRKMIGFAPDEDISGIEIFDSFSEPSRKVMEEEAFPAVFREGGWSGESTLMARDGREIPMSIVLLGHRSADGQTEYISTISRDITERKRTEEAWRERARRDPLTGVLNHGAIVEELQDLLSRNGAGASCAVAMVDVDGLKAVNDSYGHGVGDAVLVATAQALAREGAVVGRYGGDEFVVILPGADRTAAESYRDRVLDALARNTLMDPETGACVRARASIGIALYPQDADTVGDLIRFSDSAMYGAKRQRPFGAGKGHADRAAEMVGQVIPLLTSKRGLNDKLQMVSQRISTGVGYDAVTIDLYADPELPPTARAVHAPDGASEEVIEGWLEEQRKSVNPPLAKLLRSSRRAIVVEDPQNDQRFTANERALARAAEVQSALVVPFLWEDELVGTLSVASKEPSAFGPEDVQFLTAVAIQVTAVVRMVTLLEELRTTSDRLAQARGETVMLLAASAEAHDQTTGLHLQSVRALTKALALELGWDEVEAQELALASALHDIGKIRVPDVVLASSDKLAKEEWDLMKHHTTWGQQFLTGRPGLELAAVVARSHHEWWDGSGYPDGLARDAIPEAATIVSVADSFDAMTSERSYRATLSADEAVREIVACSGTQFSPKVVAALQRLRERDELPVRPAQGATREAAA